MCFFSSLSFSDYVQFLIIFLLLFSFPNTKLSDRPINCTCYPLQTSRCLRNEEGVFYCIFYRISYFSLISKLLHSIPFLFFFFFFRFDFLVLFFHLLASGSIMWKVEYKRVCGGGCGGENLKRNEVTQ